MAERDDDISRGEYLRETRFTGPWPYVGRMLVFVAAVATAIFLLYPTIEEAFLANVYINGAIVVILVLGVAFTFHQTLGIAPAANWLKWYQRNDARSQNRAPAALIAPMAKLLSETGRHARISSASARSMLDSVGARMSEAGEITRYAGRLLIFLGLLGTFWGLLQTVGSLVDTVNALSTSTDATDESIAALFTAIGEPLKGMGTAFSSSLFGLAGSLILGFLDLSASQAQNRFYNEVEDMLTEISRVGFAGPASFEGAGGGTYVNALLEQTAESLDRLQSTIARAEEGRGRANEALAFLATELSTLNDRLGRQEEAMTVLKDRASDDSFLKHLRNIDTALGRYVTDGATEREQQFRELRNELRTLAKTIAAVVEGGRS